MFQTPHILLASKSPRRIYLLKEAGFNFTLVNIDADEDFPPELKRDEVCRYLAEHKATHFTGKIGENVLVTADTIVSLEDEVINKPQNEGDAFQMLSKLSGRVHQVYTAVCLRNDERSMVFCEKTDVAFFDLTPEEIEFYIEKFHPMDKAGAYGVQDWMGFIGVKKITGCFYNVMGFPISRFYRELRRFGV